MRVTINGEEREVVEGTTVAMLVDELVRNHKGVAVAVNEEVVPRSTWRGVSLRAGDRVEVLKAAQGG